MKKILLITGSYPPDVCGVGDASYQTINTLTGQKWELYHRRNWQLHTFFAHIKAIRQTGATHILMQFPTRGYAWSIVPHLLSVYFSCFTRKRFGVIIHEQSQQSLKAYLAELLILIFANRLIFTNQFERNFAIKRIPLMARRSTVVKIFSNIPKVKTLQPVEKRQIDIAYFGQIMPNKGLERFIDDITPLAGKYKVVVMGATPAKYEDYFKEIEKQCKNSGIEMRAGLNSEKVAEVLNTSKIVYLPFPDGVSERRGSLFAAMLNGAVVATTVGEFTTPELAAATINVDKTRPETILLETKLLETKQQVAAEFMTTQMPQSWEDVATGYYNFMTNEI